jgi:hypothetical protein
MTREDLADLTHAQASDASNTRKYPSLKEIRSLTL